MRGSKFVWLLLVAGACGGSGGGDHQLGSDGIMRRACEHVVDLRCNPETVEDCLKDVGKARTESAAKGCGPAFDQIMVCYGEKLTGCSQSPRDVCKPEFDALDACEKKVGGDECSLGFGGAPPGSVPGFQQCDVWCPTWSVHCETDASSKLLCSCTAGPKSGTTFVPTACKEVTVALAAQHCQG